jgi:hypothetical protein
LGYNLDDNVSGNSGDESISDSDLEPMINRPNITPQPKQDGGASTSASTKKKRIQLYVPDYYYNIHDFLTLFCKYYILSSLVPSFLIATPGFACCDAGMKS